MARNTQEQAVIPGTPIEGSNATVERDGNLLIIRVDLTQDLGPTKMGKSTRIAGTQGFKLNIDGHDHALDLDVRRNKKGAQKVVNL